MFRLILLLSFSFVTTISAYSHNVDEHVTEYNPNIETEKLPWTASPMKNDPNDFQFVLVTDRTGSHRPGIFPTATKKLNLLQP